MSERFCQIFDCDGEQLLVQKVRTKDDMYAIQMSCYAGEQFDVIDITVPFQLKEQRDKTYNEMTQQEADHFYEVLRNQAIIQMEQMAKESNPKIIVPV